jgi:hypothetical protein
MIIFLLAFGLASLDVYNEFLATKSLYQAPPSAFLVHDSSNMHGSTFDGVLQAWRTIANVVVDGRDESDAAAYKST